MKLKMNSSPSKLLLQLPFNVAVIYIVYIYCANSSLWRLIRNRNTFLNWFDHIYLYNY